MLLAVKGLTKEYLRRSTPFLAVDHCSLSVGRGDFAVIIGQSGSGKSTFLNLIAGLVQPTEGEVWINGRALGDFGDREMAGYRNGTIGYIPQGHTALANLTVLENVMLPFYLHARQGDACARAKELLARMGIAELESAYPKELSGGELRRVSIARSLINAPDLLIADEPTTSLDAASASAVVRLLSGIAKQGTAVLMVTHQLSSIGADMEVYEMKEGRLTKYQEVQPQTEELYGV